MNDTQSKLPLATFWYGVTFLAGLYWGISFYSGAFGRAFALFLPPAMCFGTAVVAAGGDRRRIILGALTLYVNFLFTFGIGYGLASAGIICFIYVRKALTMEHEAIKFDAGDMLIIVVAALALIFMPKGGDRPDDSFGMKVGLWFARTLGVGLAALVVIWIRHLIWK